MGLDTRRQRRCGDELLCDQLHPPYGELQAQRPDGKALQGVPAGIQVCALSLSLSISTVACIRLSVFVLKHFDVSIVPFFVACIREQSSIGRGVSALTVELLPFSVSNLLFSCTRTRSYAKQKNCARGPEYLSLRLVNVFDATIARATPLGRAVSFA